MFFNVHPQWAILNDINNDIYNFFTILRDNRLELEDAMKYVWNGTKWKEEYKSRTDPIGRAIYFILNNIYGRFKKPIRFYKKFDAWAKYLDAARLDIWNKDFRDAFDILERTRWGWHKVGDCIAWIYEDPPYVAKEGVYNVDFPPKFHVELAELNHTTRHNVILSYQDHPLVRELYHDWHVKEFPYYSRMTNEHHVELLLSNRPLIDRSQVNLSRWITAEGST